MQAKPEADIESPGLHNRSCTETYRHNLFRWADIYLQVSEVTIVQHFQFQLWAYHFSSDGT